MNRRWARIAFVLIALLGTAYYWLGPGLQVRSDRRTMLARSLEWWQGMGGRGLTHHRPGLQVAYLHPQTGQLSAVWDTQVDFNRVDRLLVQLPEGYWAAVTVLSPGDESITGGLQAVLQKYGWQGTIPPKGAAIGIFSRSGEDENPHLVASKVTAEPDARLILYQRMLGRDGNHMAADFPIHVKE